MHFYVILAKANGESADADSNTNSVKVAKGNAVVKLNMETQEKYHLIQLRRNGVERRFTRKKVRACNFNDQIQLSGCRNNTESLKFHVNVTHWWSLKCF